MNFEIVNYWKPDMTNFMYWNGVYTDGECGPRGTRLYLRNLGAMAQCGDCNGIVSCSFETCDATNCCDTWSMRAESIAELIKQIETFKTPDDWRTKGCFANNTDCETCGAQEYSPLWVNKEAVLDELHQANTYARANRVFQDWI